MQESLEQFRQNLDVLRLQDAQRLSKKLDTLIARRNKNLPYDKGLATFKDQLVESIDAAIAKHNALPTIVFPENLPISDKREDIAELIHANQVLVLAGETGSGKTTQLPKICMSIGRGIRGMIGHTQPRRIAARTVASRIAEELSTELGSTVGYQVRFTDHTTENTFVKLMTDGILLAEIQNDPLLWRYDTIIIDEAHERSLNIDFLLGYLKQILPKRPDLKLIITSATIDLDRFSKHFNNAPVIEISGRTYPVETRYRPWQEEHEDINESIVGCVEEILSSEMRGDILIFLSGEREIREASHALKKAQFQHLEILPLYARLSLADQNRIFQNHRGVRVVLSTNVAETSITVPGIRYVIDPGYARISRYSIRTKVQRLPIEPISKASANQRQGRCGRVSDGVCYRLYSEEDFESRPDFTDAEILRTNLAAVILQMLHMRIGDVRKFPFVDKPDSRLISDGFKLLEEIRAVDTQDRVTPLGRSLSTLPLDPRLAAVVFEAVEQNCLREALIIVSALSIQDPRDRPADKKQAADEKHRRFNDEHSDFSAYLNLWDYLEGQRQELSQGQFRKLCQKEFINYLRVREWRDLHHQLRLAIKKLGLKEAPSQASYENLHRAFVRAYLTQIGSKEMEKGSREYLGTRQKKFVIFPGSSQVKKKSKWILAAEFIETSQLFAHCVARIEPEWVLDYAQHLVKKHYFEPHYDVKSGQVRAFVRTSLLGLVLQEKKSVAYNKIDSEESSRIFIREALVEGKYRGKGDFFTHNRALCEEVLDLEAKSRRRDIMVDDEAIFAFYRARVPQHISNLAGFEHWRKQSETGGELEQDSGKGSQQAFRKAKENRHVQGNRDPRFLFMSKNDLMLHQADDITAQQFPSEMQLGDYTVQVVYHFEPGKVNDGVNIQVPVEILHDIPEEPLQWLVPGLLREKCIALVKALPKAKRKNFVPVPDFVDRVLPRLNQRNTFLTEALAQALSHISNITVDATDWADVQLDEFYQSNIQVLDEHDKVLDQSRDLHTLRQRYRAQVKRTLEKVGDKVERSNISTWDFGNLPKSVELTKGKVKIKAYPSLVAGKNSVDLKVLDNPLEASYRTWEGLLRLAALDCSQTTKYLRKNLLKGKDLGLSVVSLGKRDEVLDDIILAAISESVFKQAITVDFNLPESKADYEALLDAGKSDIVAKAERYESFLVDTLKNIIAIKKAIKSHKNPLGIALAARDISGQLDAMVYPRFLHKTPLEHFQHFPRYLQAIALRLEKMEQNTSRDNAHSRTLAELWQLHENRLAAEGEWAYFKNLEWQAYRWMLEELRVSYFAQSLKTQMTVSEKRIKKQWQQSLS